MLKIPGPEAPLTDIIDHIQSSEEKSDDAFPLRPSSATKCSRAMAMELANWYGKASFPRPKVEPNVLRLFGLGYSVENQEVRLLEQFVKINPDLRIRFRQQFLPVMKLPNGQIVGGSSDAWLCNRLGTESGIIDIKSKKDSFSSHFKTKWDEEFEKLSQMKTVSRFGDTGFWVEDLPAFLIELDDHFFASNFEQLNIYCTTQFAKDHGVSWGSIVRVNKNDSRHIEIRFAPSEALAQKFKDKCLKVFQAVESSTSDQIRDLPCDYVPGSAAHAFCDCSKMAGEDPQAAMKAWFKTFPPKAWPTDLWKIDDRQLHAVFGEFEKFLETEVRKDRAEQEIIARLKEKGIQKVRLPNSHVYEVKAYKSGGISNGPRVALKRTKA